MVSYDTRNWMAILTRVHGTVLPRIAVRVALVAAVGVAVTLLARERVVDLSIPASVHTLVGVALGLLLVFRTNASYDRFWEGRRLWGSIVNESRNLARTATTWLAGDQELAARVVRWNIAFAWTTMHQLRGTQGLGEVAEE